MEDVKLFGYTLWKKSTESMIRSLFDEHEKALKEQKERMCEDIHEWRDETINRIRQYATEQIMLVEQKYKEKLDILYQTADQFVVQVRIHETMNKTEEINHLLEQCRGVKFQLAALQKYDQPLLFIEVPRKKRTVMNQNKNGTDEDAFLGSSSIEIDEGNANDNQDTRSKLYPNMGFTTEWRRDSQLLSMNSNGGYNNLANSNDKQDSIDVSDTNHLADKCPVCFMIFSTNMTAYDRARHAEEHYVDD